MTMKSISLNDDVPEIGNIRTYSPSPQVHKDYGPDRVSFVHWPDLMDPEFNSSMMENKSPIFVVGKRIFLKGLGYVVPKFSQDPAKRQAEENELIAMYCVDDPSRDSSKAIQPKFGTLIVVWPPKDTNKAPVVLPWLMPPTVFDEVRGKHSRMPLWSHDLEVTAKAQGNWTNLKVEITSGNVFHALLKKKESGDAKSAAQMDVLLAKARELVPMIGPAIGKELTLAEIKQRRGLERSSSGTSSEVSAAVSGDVASLVAGILAD